jgi:2-polyprenyl-3-methyl-5-hydroxy-6-metoxy-1,4-benzoquinol methylase
MQTMPEAIAFTERQTRERQYYDEYSRRHPPIPVPSEVVEGTERRPWNPYWFVAELVRAELKGQQKRLLDFGCGPGNYSVQFARMGFTVHGFDISPNNVQISRELAEQHHVADRTFFVEGAAEDLEYPDNFFDVIAGIDILHHVDIAPAIHQCLRVLRPGGVAIFKEPVEVPVFDRLRNSAVGTWLVPKTKSFDRHVTEDERKLVGADLDLIRSITGNVIEHRFRVLTRIEALGLKLMTRRGASVVEMLDCCLLSAIPPLRRFGGNVVLVFRKRS